MVDYKKMYTLMDEAVSDSIKILSTHSDENAMNWVRFLLQQARMKSNYIYAITTNNNYKEENENK